MSGPGEGKSTYLRALANRIPLTAGQVVYNGRNFDQAAKEGVDLKKMTQYVDQVDTHLPQLTVFETLDFAHQLTSVKYDPQRVEDAITLLGMEECRNTIIGNALIRGVSGMFIWFICCQVLLSFLLCVLSSIIVFFVMRFHSGCFFLLSSQCVPLYYPKSPHHFHFKQLTAKYT